MIHLGDITKINGAEIPIVDVITGGSPCQDLSVAGARAGLGGERSGLFMEQIRIVKEMREHDRRANKRSGWMVRPRYMVWENVPGALSSNQGEDFQTVLTEIVKIVRPKSPNVPLFGGDGNKRWPKAGTIAGVGEDGTNFSISYRVHDAQFWGVPQRRKRIALVADFGGLSAPEILFERKGMRGNPDESKQTGEETPGDSGDSTQATSYTLKVRGGVERDSNGKQAGKGALVQTEMSGTLGVSQDQTLFALEGNGSRPSHSGDGYKETDTMYTLNTIETHAVACGVTSKGNGDCFINENTHTSLSSGGGQAGQGYPCVLCEDKAKTLDASYYKGCGERNGEEREVVCVGNGQLSQARISDKAGALNCMHDQQAVLEIDGVEILNKGDSQGNQVADDDGTYPTLRGCGGAGYQQGYCLQKEVLAFDRAAYNQGKNAKYDFSVEEDVAQPVVAKGPGGVMTDDSVHNRDDSED